MHQDTLGCSRLGVPFPAAEMLLHVVLGALIALGLALRLLRVLHPGSYMTHPTWH